MIYLKKSSAYKKDGGYEDILKIGYSANKKTLKKRDNDYLSLNPTSKTLAVIEGGTLTDEANLHQYFAKYRKYGNEWFSYSEEIIEFFRTHTTKESLSGLPTAISNVAQAKIESFKRNYRDFLISVKQVSDYVNNRLLIELRNSYNFMEDAMEWLSENYPDLMPYILQNYEDIMSSPHASLINYYRDTSILITTRLREFCETTEFTDEEKKIIAPLISEKFGKIYNILGPKRCRALSYNTYLINKEIQDKLIDRNVIKNKFLEVFKVGERYTNKYIKKLVGNIYTELSLSSKNPKGIDIAEYFKIKPVTIIKGGKKINGQEILAIR